MSKRPNWAWAIAVIAIFAILYGAAHFRFAHDKAGSGRAGLD